MNARSQKLGAEKAERIGQWLEDTVESKVSDGRVDMEVEMMLKQNPVANVDEVDETI